MSTEPKIIAYTFAEHQHQHRTTQEEATELAEHLRFVAGYASVCVTETSHGWECWCWLEGDYQKPGAEPPSARYIPQSRVDYTRICTFCGKSIPLNEGPYIGGIVAHIGCAHDASQRVFLTALGREQEKQRCWYRLQAFHPLLKVMLKLNLCQYSYSGFGDAHDHQSYTFKCATRVQLHPVMNAAVGVFPPDTDISAFILDSRLGKAEPACIASKAVFEIDLLSLADFIRQDEARLQNVQQHYGLLISVLIDLAFRPGLFNPAVFEAMLKDVK